MRPCPPQVTFQQVLYALHAVDLTSSKGRHERSFVTALASLPAPAPSARKLDRQATMIKCVWGKGRVIR